MSRKLRLYWYRGNSSTPNFGDDLSQHIVRHVTGCAVSYAPLSRCDIVAIGSVLQRLSRWKERVAQQFFGRFRGRRPVIWGSGVIHPIDIHNQQFEVAALRGPNTAACLGQQQPVCFGDPAILIRDLFPDPVQGSEVGIVPHYVDKNHAAVREIAKDRGYRIIDVEQDALSVSEEMRQCGMILSSSLHGLIVADAFQIPCVRLSMGCGLKGGDYKFEDYCRGIQRESFAVQRVEQPEDIEQAVELARHLRPALDEQKVITISNNLRTALLTAIGA